MVELIRQKAERLSYILAGKDKEYAEIKFWRKQIAKYISWYKGELTTLYGHPAPVAKVVGATEKLSALLTFFEVHQKVKYEKDLGLSKDAFVGMKVLDIGSGPFPSALTFEDCDVYSLDPLIDNYLAAGYPIHCYEPRGRFVHAKAEDMPFTNGFFDAVISVNAIDHVNDFGLAAKEVQRVLKPGGKFRMHVHYHPKTAAEPIELNDQVFLNHYSWVNGINKISASKDKTGTSLDGENKELYVVWGN